MPSEQFIQYLIYTHAALGGLALITGGVSMATKKGGVIHRKWGKWFVYLMVSTALIAIIVSTLPNHHSTFLLLVGVMSSYFAIGGYRSLRFKRSPTPDLADKLLGYGLLIAALVMISYPFFIEGFNVVLFLFGLLSLFFAVRDITLMSKPDQFKRNFLAMHIGKMVGAYISAVTAFIVVNQLIPGLWGWISPGVVGGFYIAYMTRKYVSRRKTKAT